MEAALVLASLFSAIASFAAALAAWKAYQVTKGQLRYDLYDRRMAVYNAIMSFVADCVRDGRVPEGAESRLLHSTREARFLFGEDVQNYITEMYDVARKWRKLDRTSSTRTQDGLEEDIKIGNWILKQASVVDDLFSPYLKFEEISGVNRE